MCFLFFYRNPILYPFYIIFIPPLLFLQKFLQKSRTNKELFTKIPYQQGTFYKNPVPTRNFLQKSRTDKGLFTKIPYRQGLFTKIPYRQGLFTKIPYRQRTFYKNSVPAKNFLQKFRTDKELFTKIPYQQGTFYKNSVPRKHFLQKFRTEKGFLHIFSTKKPLVMRNEEFHSLQPPANRYTFYKNSVPRKHFLQKSRTEKALFTKIPYPKRIKKICDWFIPFKHASQADSFTFYKFSVPKKCKNQSRVISVFG
jgi:hypothetical protein